MQILELMLTATNPAEQAAFYGGVLGLPVEEGHAGSAVVRAGATRLSFLPDRVQANYAYHFAFNIRPRKFADAAAWLAGRGVTRLALDGRDRFRSERWNADLLYFRDPAGNIVEFIARHDLPDGASGAFSPADVLCVSEIGLAVPDVPTGVADLRRTFGPPVYKDSSDTFTPLGDERGLLIVVREGRPWFPTDTPALPLLTRVVLEGEEATDVGLEPLPYWIAVRPPA
jgi:catechol 2,3-dioxygenase-like lactoylglutathione lyase family enzyme